MQVCLTSNIMDIMPTQSMNNKGGSHNISILLKNLSLQTKTTNAFEKFHHKKLK